LSTWYTRDSTDYLVITKIWASVATVCWILISAYIAANHGCYRECHILTDNARVQTARSDIWVL